METGQSLCIKCRLLTKYPEYIRFCRLGLVIMQNGGHIKTMISIYRQAILKNKEIFG